VKTAQTLAQRICLKVTGYRSLTRQRIIIRKAYVANATSDAAIADNSAVFRLHANEPAGKLHRGHAGGETGENGGPSSFLESQNWTDGTIRAK
jgi:hypothetical protein